MTPRQLPPRSRVRLRREERGELRLSSPRRDLANKTNTLKWQLTVPQRQLFPRRSPLPPDSLPFSRAPDRRRWRLREERRRIGGWPETLYSTMCFHVFLLSHMCALSLQLMALFYWISSTSSSSSSNLHLRDSCSEPTQLPSLPPGPPNSLLSAPTLQPHQF